jgi:hypothetical protein
LFRKWGAGASTSVGPDVGKRPIASFVIDSHAYDTEDETKSAEEEPSALIRGVSGFLGRIVSLKKTVSFSESRHH